VATEEVVDEAPVSQVGQRVQPKRQPKAKRPPKGGVPAVDTEAAGGPSDTPTEAPPVDDQPVTRAVDGTKPDSTPPVLNGTPKTPARKKPKSGR
jgi:hypothetical protein